ncbi:glycosyl hydrolase family 18 protein [Limnochorda pilosa]|uniref:Chitinase n=1 Tax=Limnochorda pilosa TaxID=1555112 RepID=A0A0K2SMR9_LIMPI|nr:glycosyl hydrolase family 18 protein [Limnochorda pilosa]BAS28405.1 chitinase [Limnochorda pilosa]
MSTNTLSLAIIGLLALGGLLGGGRAAPPAVPPSSPPVEAPAGEGNVVEVRSDQAWVREAPGSTEKLAVLSRGSRVTQVGQAGRWVQVQLPDGREGWLSGMMVGVPSLNEREGRREVWGYYVEGPSLSSWSSFEVNADRLSAVVPWSFTVDGQGRLAVADGLSEAELARVLQRAGATGLGTHLLVQNYRNGRFDDQIVHDLLRDPQARERAAEAMVAQAKAWGAQGIHLDLENVPPLDRPFLTAFVAELSQSLRGQGLELSMALPAKTEDRPSHAWSGAFDYPALAPNLDRAVLMTYDQHHRTGSPGPIASAPWVEEVVQYALSAGFAPDKVLLGLAGYGYDWPRAGTARVLTHAQVLALLDEERRRSPGVSLHWDSSAKTPYFAYGSGNQVWFEDQQSLGYKLRIADRYGLGGVALWRLGQEDAGSWSLLTGG